MPLKQPPPAKLLPDLVVGHELACVRLGFALGKALEDVEVVDHFLECAIVRELVQQTSNSLLGLHRQDLTTPRCMGWPREARWLRRSYGRVKKRSRGGRTSGRGPLPPDYEGRSSRPTSAR